MRGRLQKEMLERVVETPLSGENVLSGELAEGLAANNAHLLSIKRVPLPVIFVPGIMASRLRHPDLGMAWDPESLREIMRMLKRQPEDRYTLLGNTPTSLIVDTQNPSHNKKFNKQYPHGVDRRWGGLLWGLGGYKDIILALDNWQTDLKLLLDIPIYAFPYNWMLSNAINGVKLREYISEVLGNHPHATQVILITHSMGGMVARHACKDSATAERVFGIIHGAQPALGAVDAYSRMISGQYSCGSISENIAANVIGSTGQEITAVLAYTEAGLQLLPTQHYHIDPASSPLSAQARAWIHIILRKPDGSHVLLESLPKMKSVAGGTDPYATVYLEEKKHYRLIHKDWLLPNSDAWSDIQRNIIKAHNFHVFIDDPVPYAHPQTIQLYSDGRGTFCEIIFEYSDVTDIILDKLNDVDELNYLFSTSYKSFRTSSSLQYNNLLASINQYVVQQYGTYNALIFCNGEHDVTTTQEFMQPFTWDDVSQGGLLRHKMEGKRVFHLRTLNRQERIGSLNLPRINSGDGTVPLASGRALDPTLEAWPTECHAPLTTRTDGKTATYHVNAAEHASFFDTQAIEATLNALHNLCLNWIDKNKACITPEAIGCDLECIKEVFDGRNQLIQPK